MNLIAKNLILWCLSLTVKSARAQSCDYVRNLGVLYKDGKSPDWKQTIVNGCINEAAFNNTDISEIHIDCKDPPLSQIGPNFVNNIKSLQVLTISRCKFETIEPGAFLNLPSLREVVMYLNSLKEIKKGVFDGVSSVNTIHLHYNKISYIEDDTFANLPNLKFIDMNDNQCEFMRREWFTNTTGITTFFMGGNNLRQIPPRMFEGWSKLEWFNLNNNKISIIHDGAFKDIAPLITNLDLHLNRLTTLSLKSFSQPLRIEVLRISANLLNYLPEELVKNADVHYLYIHGNPFKCACLDRINWVLSEKGGVILDNHNDPYFYKPCYDVNAPVCVVPVKSSYCQDTVDSEATKTYLMYLKEIGYDKLESLDKKCAMFDGLTL